MEAPAARRGWELWLSPLAVQEIPSIDEMEMEGLGPRDASLAFGKHTGCQGKPKLQQPTMATSPFFGINGAI